MRRTFSASMSEVVGTSHRGGYVAKYVYRRCGSYNSRQGWATPPRHVPIAISPKRSVPTKPKIAPVTEAIIGEITPILVGLIGKYSNLTFPQIPGEKLGKALDAARSSARIVVEHQIRDVRRRLGEAQIRHLVEDYESGVPTTELTKNYDLGKSTVLKLLRESGTSMRRAGIPPATAELAADLYLQGRSLKSIARELAAPRSSLRIAIVQLGVPLRPTS